LKEKQRLSLSDTTAILEQVASALDYAHRRNVIHRDVKPANVMLDAANRVTVTDFGIAKQLAAGSFTASGSVIGTPYYMSPEQCAGSKTLTGAADQYSLAVMAYQMLSGQLPFEGDSAIDILAKHCTQPPPPLDIIRPGLPDSVYRAIEKALSKRPEERFPSVGAFVEALKQPPASVTVEQPRRPSFWHRAPTVTAPGVAQRKARRVRPLTALSLVGLVAVGGAALALWQWEGKRLRGKGSAAELHTASAAAPGRDTTRTQVASTQDTLTAAAKPEADSTATSRPGTGAPQPAPAKGRLVISGLPPGGAVRLNGERRSGTSFELPAGTYRVGLSAPGYRAVADTLVTIRPGRASWLVFAQSPVDRPNEPIATPLGRQRQEMVQPAPSTARSPGVSQTPNAMLVVRSVGGWARIFVDGTFRREGTSHRDTLPPGRHTVRLERQGFLTVDTVVTLQPAQELLVTVAMQPLGQSPGPAPATRPAEATPAPPAGPAARPAVLVIRVTGGWARIYVDNVLRREGTSHRDTLPAGTHRVRLEREGFATVDTTVTLRAGEEQLLAISLRPGGS
jgi:hypothetical protein